MQNDVSCNLRREEGSPRAFRRLGLGTSLVHWSRASSNVRRAGQDRDEDDEREPELQVRDGGHDVEGTADGIDDR